MIFRKRQKSKEVFDRDTLIPPEGVPLHLQIAGVGVRIAAQTTDVLLTIVAVISLMILLSVLGLASPQTMMGIGSVAFFLIRVPYYIISEIGWNGQTLGKRLMKIKVVSQDGRSLTAHSLVVRNLMKEAEVFLPGTLLFMLDEASPITSLLAFGWILATLLVPLFNKRRRRLGDFIAGTYVIHLPVPILLKDLSEEAPAQPVEGEDFTFLAHHLEFYGSFELQTLEDLLRKIDLQRRPEDYAKFKKTVGTVVENIRKKINFADVIAPEDHVRFLQTFYNAQRAHLEQRQLFGDRRADKFHAKADENT